MPRTPIQYLFLILLIPISQIRTASAAPVETSVAHARQVRPGAEPSRAIIRGVVTAFSGWKNSFFLQDSTGGISVDRRDTTPVEAGDEVEISGVIQPGFFAPVLVSDQVKILGKHSLPRAFAATYEDLAQGQLDSRWVEITGVVHSARVGQIWGRNVLFLDLYLRGGHVTVHILNFTGRKFDWLVDSSVRIRGVAGTKFNDRRQFTGLRLFVESLQNVVTIKPSADLAQTPVTLLRDLLTFNPSFPLNHRVKVQALLTYQKPGRGFYLQDHKNALWVQSSTTESLRPGTRVEAAGFVSSGVASPVMDDAIFQTLGQGAPPAPLKLTASQVLTTVRDFSFAPYDGLLVQIPAKVVEASPSADGQSWLLRDAKVLFEAILEPPASRNEVHIQTGSRVLVTGICVVDNLGDQQSFRILMRGPADIQVLQTPPWTTAGLFLLSLISLVFGTGAVYWAVQQYRFHNSEPVHDLNTGILLSGVGRAAPIWAAAAFVVAALALAGWIWNLNTLRTLSPSSSPSAPATMAALMFGSLFFFLDRTPLTIRHKLQILCSVLVSGLGLFALLQHYIRPSSAAPSHHTSVTFMTAVCLLLSGIALCLIRSPRFVRQAQVLAFCIEVISAFNLTGYLFGVEYASAVAEHIVMAFPAVLGLFFLSLAILLHRADAGIMQPLASSAAGGLMARRLLPLAVAAPIVLGWVRWLGELDGYYDTRFGLTLLTWSNMLALTILIWISAALLNRIDLRRSQTEHSLIESAPDALLIADDAGSMLLVNAQTEILFGYSRPELLGKPVETLIPHQLTASIQEVSKQSSERGQPRRLGHEDDLYALRRDGLHFPVEVSLSPVRLGGRTLIAATVRDVTARRQAEQKNSLLASIVTSSEDAIISKSLDGIITSWNPGAERIFGYSASEALGRHVSLIIPADRLDEEAAIIRQIRKGNSLEHFETVRIRKDGTSVQVSLTVSPVRNHRGEVVGASKVLRDITRAKVAELQFRQVLESAPSGIVMINRDGDIAFLNSHTERLFAYTRDQLLHRPFELLLPQRFRHWAFCHPAVLFEDGNRGRPFAPPDLCGLRRDGSEFALEVSFDILQTDQGPMLLGALTDVTDRRETEERIRRFNEILEHQVQERTAELKTANRDLEDFAYAAAHDLKAPLLVIQNAASWLEEDLEPNLTQETRENLTLLRSRVTRMAKLLDDLLEYSRIGKSRGRRPSERVSGDILIRDILSILPSEGFTVVADPKMAEIELPRMPVQQILMNLISNAIKHHHKQFGHVEITVEDLGDRHAFFVKDDGPGIPEQFHAQIFNAFQTLKPRDQVEGSGMGLAFVRKYVEAYGGTLSLESREGKGSIFGFTFPKQPVIRETTPDYAAVHI